MAYIQLNQKLTGAIWFTPNLCNDIMASLIDDVMPRSAPKTTLLKQLWIGQSQPGNWLSTQDVTDAVESTVKTCFSFNTLMCY